MAKRNLGFRRALAINCPLSIGLPMVLALLWVTLSASASHANTITVNTIDDPGNSSECSLRGAIENANSSGTNSDNNCGAGIGADTIIFSVSGTIKLGSGGTLPEILNTLTIDGSGQTIAIDGDDLYG